MSEEEKQPQTGRPIWSGTISLGLVNVPVRLYSMIRDKSYNFHFVRQKDTCPLRYQRVCTFDDQVVNWGDVARAFEVRKGEYIIFDKKELESLRPESDKRIRLEKFVNFFDIDPVYFDSSYILAPDKSRDAYSLLLYALEAKSMAGVGKFTLRTKETPVLVHVYKGALILTTLRYADEVSDPYVVKDLAKLKEPDKKELELAEKIIENLSGNFNINEYHDAYRENVEKLIKKKQKGDTVTIEPPKKEEVKELMAALQETLEQMKKK